MLGGPTVCHGRKMLLEKNPQAGCDFAGLEWSHSLCSRDYHAVGPVPHSEDNLSYSLVQGGERCRDAHLLCSAGWIYYQSFPLSKLLFCALNDFAQRGPADKQVIVVFDFSKSLRISPTLEKTPFRGFTADQFRQVG